MLQRELGRDLVAPGECVRIADVHGEERDLSSAKLMGKRYETLQLAVVGALQRDPHARLHAGGGDGANSFADLVESVDAADGGVRFRAGPIERDRDRFEQVGRS